MNELLLDTSQSFLIIGLIKDGAIYQKIEERGNSLSAHLSASVKLLLEEASIQFKDIHQITVGVGPGSYTGTRVGVAFAETLAFGLGVPLKKVSSLAFYLKEDQTTISLTSHFGQTALLELLEKKIRYSLFDATSIKLGSSLDIKKLDPKPDFLKLSALTHETPLVGLLYFNLN